MKFQKKRKFLHTLLTIHVIFCMILSVSGCSQKEKKANTPMGRYVQHEIKLPDENAYDYNILPESLSKSNGKPLQIICNNGTLYTYENDTWSEETLDWITGTFYSSIYLTLGEDGNTYLLGVKNNSKGMGSPVIYKHTKDETTEIKIKDFNAEQYMSTMAQPKSLFVLKDHSMIISYVDHIVCYNSDGTVKYQIDQVLGGSAHCKGDQLCVINMTSDSLNTFHSDTGELNTDVSFGSLVDAQNDNLWNTGILQLKDDDTVVFTNISGIHSLKVGTTTWETKVEGTLTSLCSPNLYSKQFITFDDNYYFLYNDGQFGPLKLLEYTYDPDVPTLPEKTLKIYSLRQSQTIPQGIIAFQQLHPDVFVQYTVGMSSDNTAGDPTDYIKALNTEILAGNGPDLLVLDDLDTNDYIEKKALVDLTDISKELVQSGDLTQTIVDSCKKDGKIYSLPSRLRIPIVAGEDDALASLGSLSELAAYAKSSKLPIFANTIPDQLIPFLYDIYHNEVLNDSGQIDPDKLNSFFENMLAITDHSTFMDEKTKNSVTTDNSLYPVVDQSAALSFATISEVRNIQSALCLLNESHAHYQIFNDIYKGVSLMGLSSSSKESELSKEFIKQLLNKECQNYDLYEAGLPVSQSCLGLDKICHVDFLEDEYEEGFDICTFPYSDSKNTIQYVPIPLPTEKDTTPMLETLASIKYLCNTNILIKNKVVSLLTSCAQDGLSIEDAVSQLNDFAKIYNAE